MEGPIVETDGFKDGNEVGENDEGSGTLELGATVGTLNETP